MALLKFIYKNGLWLSGPVFCCGIILLWFFVATAARLGARNRICDLPLKAEQMVEFAEAGKVVLWLEGPLLTTRFGGLSFELVGAEAPSPKGRKVLFRQPSSSFSKIRVPARVFTIADSGRYLLHIKGLDAAKPGDENHRVIFTRPYLHQTIGCILGILLGAFLTIGSIVNFLLRLSLGGNR